MVRPSYVLGGRAMEIIQDEEMLLHYVAAAVAAARGIADRRKGQQKVRSLQDYHADIR